jgi:Uma2 family endonuclease
METTLELPTTETGRKRWSRREIGFLENSGLLTGHYELIDGDIISKMGQNPRHAITVMRLIAYFLRFFNPDCIRTQATMEVQEEDRPANRPEPDIVVLREVVMHIPTGEDVLLTVEVSDTTLTDDLSRKVSLYARAGVSEYWVVDLTRRIIVAYQSPNGDDWLVRTEYIESDTVAPLAAPKAVISADMLMSPKHDAND